MNAIIGLAFFILGAIAQSHIDLGSKGILENLDGISSIIIAAAALIGLTTWKSEHKHKTKSAQKEEIIFHTSKLKREIKQLYIELSFMWSRYKMSASEDPTVTIKKEDIRYINSLIQRVDEALTETEIQLDCNMLLEKNKDLEEKLIKLISESEKFRITSRESIRNLEKGVKLIGGEKTANIFFDEEKNIEKEYMKLLEISAEFYCSGKNIN